jgi:uncharacterized membrane protein
VERERRTRWIHRLFQIGVVIKGIDGVLEIAGGALLLLVAPGQLGAWARVLTRAELDEDPHDVIANLIVRESSHVTVGAKTFGGVYLFAHGLIKVGLVIALLYGLRRAYPAAMVAFALFLGYQAYGFAQNRSPFLLGLSTIDVFVIALTWLEYRRLRDEGAFGR